MLTFIEYVKKVVKSELIQKNRFGNSFFFQTINELKRKNNLGPSGKNKNVQHKTNQELKTPTWASRHGHLWEC